MRSLIKQLYGPDAKQHEAVISKILSRYWVEDKHVAERCKIIMQHNCVQLLYIDDIPVLTIHPIEKLRDGSIRRRYTHLTGQFKGYENHYLNTP